MPINRRQSILYTYRVNLYKPQRMKNGVVGLDTEYPTLPTLANVPCLFKGTEEVDVGSLIGANKEFNLVTLDVWHFVADVPIAYGWLIQFVTANPAPPQLVGVFEYVQGNSQIVPAQGRRSANYLKVFGKRDPAPLNLRQLL